MSAVDNVQRDAIFVPEGEREEYERRQREQGQYREREQSEVKQSSYMHTEVKTPMMNLPTPFISTSLGLAQQLLGEGFQASVARISGASEESTVQDYPQLEEETRRDLEAKQREQDMLAQMFEKELQRKTEAYRKQQEIETERIRKELEKQHLR
uniref:CAHS 8a n=1 Tax=Macrobiotus pallarii TaxID=576299 RepID=A0AAE9W5C0_9BILA|nr:CAHS 8a [Macrobiotus pallari]